MPQFRYRAVTPAGELVFGEVEAPSREEVVRRIEYLGHMPIEAKLQRRDVRRRGRSARRRVLAISRSFCASWRSCRSRTDARSCAADARGRYARRWRASPPLRSSISAGESFARLGPILDDRARLCGHGSCRRGVRQAGRVLRAIVEDRTRKDLLAERINAAIRYPLFLVASATTILLFFLIYVVPQFELVFKDLGDRLNPGAAFVLAASTWLHANFDLFLGTCLVLVLSAWLVLQIARAGRDPSALATIPGHCRTDVDRRTARIVGTLGLLVGNGVALPSALKILRDIVTEPR